MKRLTALLISICTITCTLTACGHDEADEVIEDTQEIVTENSEETSETDETTEESEEQEESETEEQEETDGEITENNEESEFSDDKEDTGGKHADTYEEALEIYLDCMKKSDLKGVIDISFPEGTYDVMKYLAEKEGGSIDVTLEDISSISQEVGSLQLKEITSEEPLDDEVLKMMNQMFGALAMIGDYMRESTEDISDEDFEKFYYYLFQYEYEDITLNITEGYAINAVFENVNGEEDEVELYVYLLPEEGWKVDSSMISYINKSKQSSVNANASTVFKAALTALVEMEAEGTDIDAPFIISSDTSLNYNVSSEIEDTFYETIQKYFDEIDELDYFVVMNNGSGVRAVCRKKDDSSYTGLYPFDSTLAGGSAYEGIPEIATDGLTFEEIYRLYLDALQNLN